MDLKAFTRLRAKELGFHDVGFAHAEPLSDHADRLERWIAEGLHADMTYLERNLAVRLDPCHEGMLAGARTVVCLALAYPVSDVSAPGLSGLLAWYARGPDYHLVVRDLLRRLLRDLTTEHPGIRGRTLVDTAPLWERVWAARSGLGWLGRNTCLIHPELGSGLVLGELVLSVAIEPDSPMEDRCGDCRACLSACPTGALQEPDGGELDARRCLSYWTVEARRPLPRDLAEQGVFFGCDACQSACPWNQRKTEPETPLAPLDRWRDVTLDDLARLALPEFTELIRGTALERAGAEVLRSRARKLVGEGEG